ncbi:uncharacterized protein LOC128264357 [Drosophila gunungcola]|uniref:RRM domain-containing protein n=1 Tax=Drosophila gunungcola TaxID=103775 RepID=A0A9P9YDL8_9MUSC|nr:uncharacterized protein LOC128264357 [Drosophila gunungcola]XP_052855753.1 uncharacterized protein LOC128264357 [Drosophila gunungcola]XP_052855755.1 uncharacterized protein LOC128264357 [Drosophila gunungcola]KAI8034559.1 hypothetical protein M5D96_012612 [Drosophila gunungcola]
MDIELSLDEIIERKRGHGGRPIDKKFNANYTKPRRLLNKPAFKPSGSGGRGVGGSQSDPPAQRSFDARNKIIQKTRAKIADARDLLNQSMRDSGIDARQLLLKRKKDRPLGPTTSASGEPLLTSRHAHGSVHMGHFGQRTITMSNRPGGTIETEWDSDEELVGLGGPKPTGLRRQYTNSRPNQPGKPFAPRGYVDHDNMQDLEDEEITRTLHFGNFTSQQPPPPRYTFGGFDLNRDDDVEMSTAPLKNNIASDPFAIYEVARNRIERPSLPTPLVVGRTDTSEKLFERRQRNIVNTTNLPESLRARLFGGEPDRRVSHGIYANENRGGGQAFGSGGALAGVGGGGGGGVGGVGAVGAGGGVAHSMAHPMTMRRSPPTLPLGASNSKAGYRLLVSNLHANVTTADIRELFSDIGPMYDAHVVRPGTAEVIYKSLEHAEMAVDAYHHREFDDQPMHCVLVNPHSSHRSAHSASSRTVTTNSSGVEVDIDALHSVLFRDR